MSAELWFGQLVLVNFKSYAGEQVFHFNKEPGLYFVQGINKDEPQLEANGTGKSTLLADALMWVLFEKTIRDNRPADSVASWGKAKVHTEVSITFRRGGNGYTLTRSRRPNALTVLEGDADKPRTIDQAEVERILGMNEDMFRRTIILGQFGSLFLDMMPEAQSQMFTDALNLNVWLRAADRASQEVKNIDRDVTKAEQSVNVIKSRRTELESSLTRAKESAANWAGDNERAMADAEELLASRKGKLADAKKDAPERPAKGKKAPPTADSLGREIDAQRRVLRAENGKSADALAALRAAERKLEDARNNLSTYEAAAKDKVCPECGQTVSAKHLREKLAEAGQAVEDALAARDEAQAADDAQAQVVKDLDAKIDQLEKDKKAAADAERKLQEYDDDIADLTEDVEDAQKKVDDLEKATNPHNATVDDLNDRLDKIDDELKKAEDELQACQEDLQDAKYWVDAFRDIRLKRLEDALRELEMTTTRYSEQLGLYDWRIGFATERETKSGATKVGFSVMLFPPEQNEPVRWSSYCGGEVQRWQLAATFGLSEILLARAGLNPNMEVYDEPTKGLSPRGVATLIEMLHDRAIEQGKAIFLVDHHALDTGLFDGVLKVTMNKGSSTFAWVK